MTLKDKQELFDAITAVGYKETENLLLKYLGGEFVNLDDNSKTIFAWFNYWINRGEYTSDLQAVVSFIQTNTWKNPSKKSNATEFKITNKFKEDWKNKFGKDFIED